MALPPAPPQAAQLWPQPSPPGTHHVHSWLSELIHCQTPASPWATHSHSPDPVPHMNAAARTDVLVVDDEPALRELLEEYFSRHGLDVRLAEDAAHARQAVAQRLPQIAILDVNMPAENGLSLARWLREAHPSVGIVMLTTAGETVDRVVGLEVGADDYIPKPFDLRELLARVRSLARRLQPVPVGPATAAPAAAAHLVALGDCVLDLEQRRLLDGGGQEVALTAAEFDLLALFVRHPNRPLNRDQIMQQAHQRGWDVFDRSIDLRVMRLRRKIERFPDKPEILKTVRGVGYVFVPDGHGGRS